MLSIVGPAPAEEATAAGDETATSGGGAPDANASEQGTLVFGPDAAGGVRVMDSQGNVVATVFLRPEQRIAVDLPPGKYRVEDSRGTLIESVDLGSGQRVEVEVPEGMEREALPVVAPTAEDIGDEEPVDGIEAMPPAAPPPPRPVHKRPHWKRWATPLFSALTPGVGQMVNRQVGKGVGILLGTVGLGVGTLALMAARNPSEGATPGDEGASNGAEVARLGAISGFTGALAMLYAGQIMDARAVAVGEPIESRTDHKINIDLVRMSTVGFRPDQPAYTLFRDWSVTVMGQVAKRFSVGLSDISIKSSATRDRATIQGGLRLSYRFFDHRRVWLAAALGNFFQGTWADPRPASHDSGATESEGAFGAVPYVQVETRFFLLDRWSLNLIPRLSVPLTTRYFSGDRAIPRYSTTFELGTGVGVYF